MCDFRYYVILKKLWYFPLDSELIDIFLMLFGICMSFFIELVVLSTEAMNYSVVNKVSEG